jgi:hypothetical protein
MKRILSLTILVALLVSCNNSNSYVAGQESPAASKGDLYLRTFMWTGMYGSSLEISWIWLYDGKIVKNPRHGVNPVDWEKEKQDNANNTGTYTMNGDKMNITWSDGKTASWGIGKKEGEITEIDGGIATQQDAMPAGYRLDGKYAASVVLPNVSSSHTIVFKKDGTFSSDRFGSVSTPETSKTSQSAEAGTYDISGNTLTMKFSNGQVEKSVIAIWKEEDETNLVINSSYYPQEK